eukprot:TRINITY_DN1057_c0_g1_i1.p1 TRINITY_DN1057_c0_g1~~TRINITY_DN1057_c0_g1_i1.p1  ORF type:complete len:414 (+),score=179.35 TRINITY_DN1057_c0_g1_i1:54-1244(+)
MSAAPTIWRMSDSFWSIFGQDALTENNLIVLRPKKTSTKTSSSEKSSSSSSVDASSPPPKVSAPFVVQEADSSSSSSSSSSKSPLAHKPSSDAQERIIEQLRQQLDVQFRANQEHERNLFEAHRVQQDLRQQLKDEQEGRMLLEDSINHLEREKLDLQQQLFSARRTASHHQHQSALLEQQVQLLKPSLSLLDPTFNNPDSNSGASSSSSSSGSAESLVPSSFNIDREGDRQTLLKIVLRRLEDNQKALDQLKETQQQHQSPTQIQRNPLISESPHTHTTNTINNNGYYEGAGSPSSSSSYPGHSSLLSAQWATTSSPSISYSASPFVQSPVTPSQGSNGSPHLFPSHSVPDSSLHSWDSSPEPLPPSSLPPSSSGSSYSSPASLLIFGSAAEAQH